jgi:hypothetical protein
MGGLPTTDVVIIDLNVLTNRPYMFDQYATSPESFLTNHMRLLANYLELIGMFTQPKQDSKVPRTVICFGHEKSSKDGKVFEITEMDTSKLTTAIKSKIDELMAIVQSRLNGLKNQY